MKKIYFVFAAAALTLAACGQGGKTEGTDSTKTDSAATPAPAPAVVDSAAMKVDSAKGAIDKAADKVKDAVDKAADKAKSH